MIDPIGITQHHLLMAISRILFAAILGSGAVDGQWIARTFAIAARHAVLSRKGCFDRLFRGEYGNGQRCGECFARLTRLVYKYD